jgi:tetratricopeptide (TPR) repeat protein
MQAAARSRDECLERARALGDPEFGHYLTLYTSGVSANRESVVQSLKDELRAMEARGDAEWQLTALARLGGELAAGQQKEAEVYWHRALALARELGSQLAIANAMTNIAAFHRMRGDLERAIGALLEAMLAREASGDVLAMAVTARDLGLAYRSAGRLDEAIQWLEKALTFSRRIRDRGEEAFVLRDAAMVDADAGDYWKALERMRLLLSTWSILSIGFLIASIVPTARFAQPIGAAILYPMLALCGLFAPLCCGISTCLRSGRRGRAPVSTPSSSRATSIRASTTTWIRQADVRSIRGKNLRGTSRIAAI